MILTWAGGTCPPRAASIGFPGATRMSRNTKVSRISTIGTTSARRVIRYVLREVPVTWANNAGGTPVRATLQLVAIYDFESSQKRM